MYFSVGASRRTRRMAATPHPKMGMKRQTRSIQDGAGAEKGGSTSGLQRSLDMRCILRRPGAIGNEAAPRYGPPTDDSLYALAAAAFPTSVTTFRHSRQPSWR